MSAGDALDRIGRALRDALAWAWRESAALLPDGLAGAGTARRAELITLDADGAPASTGGAARSWLGRWRHDAVAGRDAVIVLIHPDRVLRRTVTLSVLAARDPERAARLQAATLSPIRLEAAALATAAPVRLDGGGAQIPLAIARRGDVEAASALARERAARWRVAADFGPDGPQAVFAEGEPRRAANPALMAIMAGLAILAALTAFDLRLARDVEALGAQRDALLAEARARRSAAAEGESPDTPAGRAAAYPVLADILSATAGLEADEIEAVRATGRRIVVEHSDGEVIAAQAGRP